MAAQAEAERDRRARITLAEGEAMAADRLLEAAQTIEKSPAALQLRLYQAMVQIGEENNTIIVLPRSDRNPQRVWKAKERLTMSVTLTP